jgi:hypothetical protein
VSFSKYDFCNGNWNKKEHRCFIKRPEDIIDYCLCKKTATGSMVLKSVQIRVNPGFSWTTLSKRHLVDAIDFTKLLQVLQGLSKRFLYLLQVGGKK